MTDSALPGIKISDAREHLSAGSLTFNRTLTQLSEESFREHINAMVARIDEQGDRLGKRVDIKEFEKYRSLIKEFLDEIVSNGYSFSKESSFASRGRHRTFATVKTVNDKLDEMAKLVLSDQADNIGMLSAIGEIRGLILDMLL
jgi:uncharacterized protein YaaR (DUF327 family)